MSKVVTVDPDADPEADLDKAIEKFSELLDGEDKTKTLGASWRWLQIYSVWGLRLPNTPNSLRAELGISDPGKYEGFFGLMVDAYDAVNVACGNFQTNVFPDVIQLGRSVLDFASDANPDDGEVFAVLIELVNEDPEGALELLGDLRATTEDNVKQAEDVAKALGGFSGDLIKAKAMLGFADSKIDEDSSVSKGQIDTLKGGSEVVGSIEHFKKLLKEKEAEYKHDVTVASTSVTYAWVFPIGLVAAATVAGVFGDKAVKALDEIDRLKGEVASRDSDLITAIQTNQVQGLANSGVEEAESYTAQAIIHTTTVKNAWSEISGNLGYVADKVAAMTKEKDDQVVLKTKSLVKAYAKRAGEKWASLVAPLKALTSDPYIVVEQSDKSPGEMAADIQKEIEKQNAA